MGQLPLQIEGIQETLKLLNDIDPKFRRLVTKQIKSAGASILSEARQMVAGFDNSKGNGAPLSGIRGTKERYVNFDRGGYTEQVVYGSKPYRLMTVQSADAAGVIYDHAGRNTTGQFVTNLNIEEGNQPRVIDVAVDKNKEAVTAEVLKVVEKVMAVTNRQMKVR